MTPPTEPLTLTIREVASRLNVSRAQVYRLIADGTLEPAPDLKPTRIPAASLTRWQARHTSTGPTAA